MGRRRSKQVVVLTASVIAAIGLAGCQMTHPGGSGAAKPPPAPGTVDLAVLTEQNPDYLLVRQTDAALDVYKQALQSSTPGELLPSIDAGRQFEPVQVRIGPGPGYSEADLDARLNNSGIRRLDALETRLSRSDQLALADAQESATLDESVRFEAQRRQIIESGFGTIESIMSADVQKRLDLNIQIGALAHDKDPLNPRTAPDDHWGKLFQQKQDELAALDADRSRKLEAVNVAQNAKIERARGDVHKETQAQIESTAKDLKTRSETRVAGYKKLLAERRSDILDRARGFDQQMVSALTVQAAKAPPAAHPVLSQPIVSKAAEATWRSRLIESIAYLNAQRTRQVTLVTEETRRAVLDVARHNNLEIVGWQPSMERHDLTPRVLKELQGRGWTE